MQHNRLFYAKDEFDKERYAEIKEISLNLINEISLENFEDLIQLTNTEEGYPTPKIDVRAFIVENDKILLVEDSVTKE